MKAPFLELLAAEKEDQRLIREAMLPAKGAAVRWCQISLG
jgi:hypothetical protein